MIEQLWWAPDILPTSTHTYTEYGDGFNELCLFPGSRRNGSRQQLVLKREKGDFLMLEGKYC